MVLAPSAPGERPAPAQADAGTLWLENGDREYLLWRTLDATIDWWRLEEDEFRRHMPASDGIHRSNVMPGLWLDSAALLLHDGARVMEVLNQGLSSTKHAAFVQSLRQSA